VQSSGGSQVVGYRARGAAAGAAETAASRTGSTAPRRRLPVPAAWLAGAWLAGAAAAFTVYLRLAETRAVNSDGASQALQAWDMLHGNPLLRGWTVSDVSFYTTELPQYALVELIRGLRADVVDIVAAMTYTLVVLLAALVAKGNASGRQALESHRLPGAGLGGYWQASVVTLTSGGTVTIRPVADDGGGIGQHPGEVDDAWFDPRRSVARFVVLSPGEPEYPGYADYRTVRAAWGAPARVYRVGQYTIW
jgi:hypothetical protein